MSKFAILVLAAVGCITAGLVFGGDDDQNPRAKIEGWEALYCQNYLDGKPEWVFKTEDLENIVQQSYVELNNNHPAAVKPEDGILLAHIALTQGAPDFWEFLEPTKSEQIRSKFFPAWVRFYLSERMATFVAADTKGEEFDKSFGRILNTLQDMDSQTLPTVYALYISGKLPKAHEKSVPPFLTSHSLPLAKVPDVTPAKFPKLLKDLGDDKFAVRDSAMKALYSVAWQPGDISELVKQLKQTKKTTLDAEVRVRTDQLLKIFTTLENLVDPDKELKMACETLLSKKATGENSAPHSKQGQTEKDVKSAKESQPAAPEEKEKPADQPKTH